jgi:hypothetical protein
MAAAEAVKQRMRRFTAALNQAGVPYAVIGGNAVASWVGSIDEDAVRNTKDVDILIRREDLEAAKAAVTAAGFIYNETLDVHMFLDGPKAKPSQGVHLLFAEEKVKPEDLVPAPPITEYVDREETRILKLEPLVLMKLTSFRRKDQVHILDMIGVGLIDATWTARFPPELAARLQELLDDPNG